MSKVVENDIFIVSSNNESQVLPQNTKFSGNFAYKISVKKIRVL